MGELSPEERMSFVYSAYGLEICSPLPLQELSPGRSRRDVVVRFGKVDRRTTRITPGGSLLNVSQDEIYLHRPEVGTFLVKGGREIRIEPDPGAEIDTLRNFLLGPILALLLHQRGHLVLHSSGIRINRGAVLFVGGSRAGKSTTAMALHDRGHTVVTDDLAVVQWNTRGPVVWPGFPQLKLWPEAASSLGRSPEKLSRIHARLEKRGLSVSGGFSMEPLPLHRIYILDHRANSSGRALTSQEALVELMRHSYHASWIRGREASGLFLQCARLVNKIPIDLLRRPETLVGIHPWIKLLEEDLAKST